MSSQNIGIIDYGMGNTRSIANAMKEIDFNTELAYQAEKIHSFDKIILPGVGAFKKAMENINENGLFEALTEFKNTGKAILGICLGMQLMCTSSTENGICSGLNWINAKVEKIPEKDGFTIPHIGWNNVLNKKNHHLFNNLSKMSDFYFVHSFCVSNINDESIIGLTDYTDNFCSAFSFENIFGVQFHPEKSQSAGLQLLQNFASLKC